MVHDDSFSSTAVILVPHGTREPAGISQSMELCTEACSVLKHEFGSLPPFYVGFFEIAEPSLKSMLQLVLEMGRQKVIVVPIMLFSADHIKKDIPALVRQVVESHAEKPVTVYITSGFGLRLRLSGLARRRQEDALARYKLRPEKTGYVMVARGTSDVAALEEVGSVYTLTAMNSCAHHRLCYFAAAEPRIEDVLEEVAQLGGISSVLVQPYLLFEGYLTNHLRKLLEQCRQEWPHITWVQTEVLWPDSSLVSILAEKVSVALADSARERLPGSAEVHAEGLTKMGSGVPYRIVSLRD
ncbi:sirohydrochlorin chelatase [Thermogutta sp.]|uniref:sirohydrochlorin chelatase n=1 Tax=Thermogutta sp. TaxID=1962930 RepID=UPI0032201C46